MAVYIGNKLDQSDASAHIVGHSLGGGLASAAQGGSDLTASTYNSAGLHPGTVAHYSANQDRKAAEPDKIKGIRVKGEVLTSMQESDWTTQAFMNDAAGKKRDLDPAITPAQFQQLQDANLADVKDKYRDYLHRMDAVIDSMEKQKKRQTKMP